MNQMTDPNPSSDSSAEESRLGPPGHEGQTDKLAEELAQEWSSEDHASDSQTPN